MGTHPIFESDFDCLTDCPKMVADDAELSLEDFINKKNIRVEIKRNQFRSGRSNDSGRIRKREPYRPLRDSARPYSRDPRRSRDLPRRSRPLTKLFINNLDFGVTDDDMKELFSEFGPLRNASILYNREGRSTGSAELVFLNPEDAREARDQYDGVPLDGRPMEITLCADTSYSSGR